ncbi:hypothetical protein [Corynebacterium urinipleomorphum]|uniref:hypothetical protein n=1 Tax=Corynebacterium urinipleomorphum TaxID=1852380 RepID=UPI000B362BB6|nr:hypothetical protein [Corynebacterium urinipleomorphum]
MNKTNKILLAVLAVLLLILGILAGLVLSSANKSGSKTIAEPFNETRYSGTLEDADGLSDEPVPVVLVVRFHDDGERGTLTSPTLGSHSELKKIGEGTYEQTNTITADVGANTGAAPAAPGGGDGTRWTFTPKKAEDADADDTGSSSKSDSDADEPSAAMDISYETPDGSNGGGSLAQTDPKIEAGEVGLNPDVTDDLNIEEVDFGEGKVLSVGKPVFQKTGDEPMMLGDADFGAKEATDGPQTQYEDYPVVENGTMDREGELTVKFRFGDNLTTVTYPERGCYGVLEMHDGALTEKILVGDCESGGTWKLLEGSKTGGVMEFLGPDKSFIGRTVIRSTEWNDITGEIGLGLTGPVVDYYKKMQAQDTAEALTSEAAKPDKNAEEGRNSRQAREMAHMTPWGYGDLEIGMAQDEAFGLGLNSSSVGPADNGVAGCTTATYSKLGVPEATAYVENGVITAITKEGGNAYFENQPIRAWQPGDDFEVVPGHEPETEQVGEWGYNTWNLEGANGNILRIRLLGAIAQTTYTAYTPDTACKP